jgi:hypothetical protein
MNFLRENDSIIINLIRKLMRNLLALAVLFLIGTSSAASSCNKDADCSSECCFDSTCQTFKEGEINLCQARNQLIVKEIYENIYELTTTKAYDH